MKSFKNRLRNLKFERIHKLLIGCTSDNVYFTLDSNIQDEVDDVIAYGLLVYIIEKANEKNKQI
jgi:hypothetical protein